VPDAHLELFINGGPMGLIFCPDCRTRVSDSAPSCPKCGGIIASRVNLVRAKREMQDYQDQIDFNNKYGGIITFIVICIGLFLLWLIAFILRWYVFAD